MKFMSDSQWKKALVRPCTVVVLPIHRLTQADISCTTTAHLFFFPLLNDSTSKHATIYSNYLNNCQNIWTFKFKSATSLIKAFLCENSSSMLHRSIERDMKTVSSALEYSYKVNKEANAQALENSTATAPSSSSSNTSANQWLDNQWLTNQWPENL